MELAFKEKMMLEEETNIELFRTLCALQDRMDNHMEKFPNYDYVITMLGGAKGAYKASITIERYDNKEIELAEGDSGSYGVL